MTSLHKKALREPRFIFVGGAHKSGTTLVRDALSQHPLVTALTNTGVENEEGQHLQDLMPSDWYLGELLFGLSDGAYLDEGDVPNAKEYGRRLFDRWAPHWNTEAHYFLEKSPPNIVRSRFLQACFPNSIFIAVIRDPRTTFVATRKVLSHIDIETFLQHWSAIYSTWFADCRYINTSLTIQYEKMVSSAEDGINGLYKACKLPQLSSERSSIVIKEPDILYRGKWNELIAPGVSCKLHLPDWALAYGYDTTAYGNA